MKKNLWHLTQFTAFKDILDGGDQPINSYKRGRQYSALFLLGVLFGWKIKRYPTQAYDLPMFLLCSHRTGIKHLDSVFKCSPPVSKEFRSSFTISPEKLNANSFFKFVRKSLKAHKTKKQIRFNVSTFLHVIKSTENRELFIGIIQQIVVKDREKTVKTCQQNSREILSRREISEIGSVVLICENYFLLRIEEPSSGFVSFAFLFFCWFCCGLQSCLRDSGESE